MSGFLSIFQALDPDDRYISDEGKPDIFSEKVATPKEYAEATQAIDTLMKDHFSCRYYLPKPVEKRVIQDIIDAARHSPSGNNIQPWAKVYCIAGDIKEKIAAATVKAHKENPEAYDAQYQYYPTGPIPKLYADRRGEFGKRFYAPYNIERSDKKARHELSLRNYIFYGAPVAFLFTIDQALTKGSWLDVGYFLQSIVLAARARGLETVSQEATAKYQLIMRQYLPIPDNEVVMVGMCMGYPDLDKIHQFYAKQPRRPVSDIIEFFGM
jgi:nitroreductase